MTTGSRLYYLSHWLTSGRLKTVGFNGLSVYLFFRILLHKRGRRQITKAGLLANSVVEDFDEP